MKKYRGSVSLFAAMIFLIIVSLITTTILSARIEGARVMVRTAASMATDSLLSCYNSELFSEFGILLFDGTMGSENTDWDKMASEITKYMSYNIETDKGLSFTGNTDLYGIELSGVSVDELITAVDAGGLLWFNEAVDYEKYAKPVDLAAEYLGLESADEQAQAVNKINDGITSCSEVILDITDSVKSIVEMVDGIECSAGIDFDDIRSTGKDYVKKFITTEMSPENVGVNNSSIYRHMTYESISGYLLLEQARNYYDAGELNKAGECLSEIKKTAEGVSECEKEVVNMIGNISDSQKLLDAGIDTLDTYISSQSDIIDDEILSGILEDSGKIKNYKQDISQQICDIELFDSIIQNDSVLLDRIIKVIDEINLSAGSDEVVNNFNTIEECMEKYSLDELTVNYEHLGKSTEDTGILDTVRAFLDNGVVGLVMPSDRTISLKNIYKEKELASASCNLDEQDKYGYEGVIDETGKKIVYSEYVMDHFYSFTDNGNDRALDYEAEYILSGKKTDCENLSEAVLKLAALRSGPNMLCIMSDSEKKDEAYALASALVGFTGVDAAVRIVQYAIMYLWSYAEGLSDVKILLKGGKVPLKKTKDTWNLSLDNLMSCHIGETEGSDKGLDYESYLKFMIFLEKNGKKSAYTMDLAELRMKQKGDDGFRLRNYVYGIGITASYRLNGLNYSFTCQDVCKY